MMKQSGYGFVFRAILLGGILAVLSSCAAKQLDHEISKDFSKQKYQRIALLVVRVGNDSPLGCPRPITGETDYSLRKPEMYGEFNAIFPGQFVAKTDVYIEDEDRLRESLPAYPKFAGLKPAIADTWVVKYYKNITPQIYKAVSALLVRKGYRVVNARDIAASWPKKLSEMKVHEIAAALKKDADAVLILHYADIGHYHSHVITGGGGTYQGFVELDYTLAMFDVNTRKRVLHFKEDSPRILDVLSEDPKIVNDPVLSKKINKEINETATMKSTSISASFTEDEIIDFAMNYLCNGVMIKTGDYTITWKGLDKAIP